MECISCMKMVIMDAEEGEGIVEEEIDPFSTSPYEETDSHSKKF